MINNINKYLIPPPPKNIEELLYRAEKIAGQNFAVLASKLNLSIPVSLKHNKGWVGMLLELHLGAVSRCKAERDFFNLGIELKTIPVDKRGKPLEDTFICTAPLNLNHGITWEASYVRHKLMRILWIPIEGERNLSLSERRVGSPMLWVLTEEDELRQDWEELMEMIVLGQISRITGHYGKWLHIRPKASNSKTITRTIGEYGEPIITVPRGFYLRRSFTQKLLEKHFLL